MTEDQPEVLTRSDIAGVAEQVNQLQESFRVVSSVGEGLRRIGGTVSELMASLELAVESQRVTEEGRRIEAEKNRQRFWVTIGGIVLANVIVIAISLVVLAGQIQARDAADERAMLNRDRQACATSLLVEWDSRLGDALRVTTQLPLVPPESPEYRRAVNDLNAATALIGRAKELCYGGRPNPDPVPR